MAAMAEPPRAPTADRIWITRGHLAALGVSTFAIAVLSFLVGLEVGRSGQSKETEPGQAAAAAFLPDVADDQALELLLREVEQARASKEPPPAVDFNSELAQPVPTVTTQGDTPSSVVTDVQPGGAPPVPPIPPAPDAAPPIGGWAVQVASYADLAEADQHVAQLKELGHSAYRVEALVSGTPWFRVRIGGFETRASAETARLGLVEQLGVPDLVLAPAP